MTSPQPGRWEGDNVKRTLAIPAVLALAAGAMVTAAAGPATAAPTVAAKVPVAAAADPDSAAAAAADRHVASAAAKAKLHLAAGDRMVRRNIQVGGRGLRYVSYDRTYKGLAVIGGDAVVVTDAAGSVLSTTVAQNKAINVNTTAKLPSAAAAATARSRFSVVTS